MALLIHQPVISTSVFIEMQHWLLIQCGLAQPISRAEYDRHRKRLESYIVLNSDSVSQQALDLPGDGPIQVWAIATHWQQL